MATKETIMGFDQNDPRPIIQPSKKTTQVNLVMVGAVIVFFLICAAAIAWMRFSHGNP